jgi:hypothetical protein
MKIRDYRNVIIHHPQIGKNRIIYGANYNVVVEMVPKKEKINDYIHWRQIEEALNDTNKLENDFIQTEKQMDSDIRELETLFNNLWSVVLQKMESLNNNTEHQLKYFKLQDIEFPWDKNQNDNMAKLNTPPHIPPPISCLGSATSNYVCFNTVPISAMSEKDMRKKT